MDISEHQSKVTRVGNAFQQQIYEFVKEELKDHSEKIYVGQPYPKAIITPPGKTPTMRRYTCLEIHTAHGTIIGDTDIVIFNKRRSVPICILSCKVSFHSRDTESLYYARLYRDKYGATLPFFIITHDWKKEGSELGSLENGTKPRILCEWERVTIYSDNPRTKLGGCVKSFSSLIPDLKRLI